MSGRTRPSRTRRTRSAATRAILTTAGLAAAVWAPSAQASRMLPEERQGEQIVSAVRARQLSANRLSSSQYERVGEYVMGREVGSPAVHERMNTMMETMMGKAATDQLHVRLGERYLRAVPARSPSGAGMMDGSGASAAGMMGRGMMGYRYPARHGIGAGPIAGIVVGALGVLGALAALLLRRRSR